MNPHSDHVSFLQVFDVAKLCQYPSLHIAVPGPVRHGILRTKVYSTIPLRSLNPGLRNAKCMLLRLGRYWRDEVRQKSAGMVFSSTYKTGEDCIFEGFVRCARAIS